MIDAYLKYKLITEIIGGVLVFGFMGICWLTSKSQKRKRRAELDKRLAEIEKKRSEVRLRR